MSKSDMKLVLELSVCPASSIIGMNGKEIEKRYGIRFIHACGSILDLANENKAIKNKNYTIGHHDYIRVEGDYDKVASFGLKASSGVKSCVV
jgi:hypothetical protein